MILIRHVVDTFNRFDTWNTYTEIDLRRKMGIGPDKAGCSIKQVEGIIDALFPGSAQGTFRGQVKSYLAKISKDRADRETTQRETTSNSPGRMRLEFDQE